MNILGDVGAGHVLGRYELLLPIARGGMATVWAARMRGSRGFQKIVAVKTMLPSVSDDPQFERMFLDEAALASSIRHANVVEILDLGEESGVLFLVMEWVDGEPLSVVMKSAAKRGGVPMSVAQRIVIAVCAGLHAAHELCDESGHLLGVVHRDVSPQNILLTFDGVVKVVDFGVAKAAGRATSDTTAGQVKGKAAYMSPEQAQGAPIDRRTDVFAVGILLYQLTTGKHPFRADNEVATVSNICSEAPVTPPSKHVPNYPPLLELVVQRALAKRADDRYASASELGRALDAVTKDTEAASQEEVATFVRNLLGERQEKRNETLRTALRLADDRAGHRPSRRELEGITHTGFTPVTSITTPGRGAATDPEATAPASARPNLLGDVRSETPGSALVAASSAPPPPQKRPLLLKLALVVGAAIAIASALRFSHAPDREKTAATPLPGAVLPSSPLSDKTAPVDTSASAANSPASPSSLAENLPSKAPPNAAEAAQQGPDAAPHALVRLPRGQASGRMTGSNVSSKRPGHPFVAPIRNPGF